MTDAPALPAEGADPELRAKLAAYIGPRADEYLALWNRHGERPTFRQRWCAAGFLVPVPWLLYRKCYGSAAVLLVVALGLGFALPGSLGTGLGIATGVVVGSLGKQWYLHLAERAIRRAESREVAGEALEEQVRRRGGVSIVGASIGGVIVGVLIAASIAAPIFAKLPACDASETRKLALQLLQQIGTQGGFDASNATMDKITQTGGDGVDERKCECALTVGNDHVVGRYTVNWEDKPAGRFRVQLRIDRN